MNPTADYELTVVIPVYNEQESLPDLFNALENYHRRASISTCFLFVNDCSTDGSFSLIREWCLRQNGFFYISLEHRSGFTGSIKAGLEKVTSPLTGFIDADLRTSPDDFELLLAKRNDVALVCGIRDHSHDNFFTHMGIIAFSKIRRMITHDDIVDTTCPLKLGKTHILKMLPWFSGMHCFLPALVKLTGHGVATVEVRYQRRMKGKSKRSVIRSALSGMCDLLVFLWMRRRYIEPAVAESNLIQR